MGNTDWKRLTNAENKRTLELALKQRVVRSLPEWEWKKCFFSAKARNIKEHNNTP